MSFFEHKYVLKSGKTSIVWEYDIQYGKHRYRGSFGHCSKSAARAKHEAMLTALREGRYHGKAEAVPTLSAFLPEFLQWYESQAAPKSLARHRYALRALVPVLGRLPLDRMTDARVDGYMAKRSAEGRSGATINREVGLLKHVLRTAVRWGKLPTYPLKGVKKRRELPRQRILTMPEQRRLLEASAALLHDVVIVALDTGLRESEIVSLRTSSVNVPHRLLTVANAYAKNRETRTLEMTGRVWEIIQRRLSITDRQSPLMGYRQTTSIKRAFRRVADRVLLGDVRFHDLRHVFATRLLLSGVELVKVQYLLGHKTIAMTMRYLTLTGGDTRGILSGLDEVGVPEKIPQVRSNVGRSQLGSES